MTDSMLSTEIRNRNSRLMLLQDRNDLFLAEPAFFISVSFRRSPIQTEGTLRGNVTASTACAAGFYWLASCSDLLAALILWKP
jgi:hypothetical protein